MEATSMPLILAGDRRFDVDLIIFDKDGTLFDFQAMWVRIFRQQAEALTAAAGGDPAFLADLYADMGVEPAGAGLDPRGPLSLATYDEIKPIMTLALYRHGQPWDQAALLVAEVTDPQRWPPFAELTCPIGDVAGLFRRLTAAGFRIGVLTTDVREMTLPMLDLAGAGHLVDAVLCAGDGVPLKPAPDGILEICRRLKIAPARTMMVGDAPTDLLAGRAAGVAACIGVTTGVSRREQLACYADVVLASIHELDVPD